MEEIYQEVAVLRDKIMDLIETDKIQKKDLVQFNQLNKELLDLIGVIVSKTFLIKSRVQFRMGEKLLTYLRSLCYQPTAKEIYGQINLAKKGKEYQIISRIGFEHRSKFYSMLRGEIFFHSHPFYSRWGSSPNRPYSPPSEADISASYNAIILFPFLVQKELIVTPEGLYVLEPLDIKKFVQNPYVFPHLNLKKEVNQALKEPLNETFRIFYQNIYGPVREKYNQEKDTKKRKKIMTDFGKKTEKYAQKIVDEIYIPIIQKLKLQMKLSYYPWIINKKKMEYILNDLIPLGTQPRGTAGIYDLTEKEFEGFSQTRKFRGGALGALVQLSSS